MSHAAAAEEFCDCVERRDGAGFARLFRRERRLSRCLLRRFRRPREIAEMIDVHFYRTGAISAGTCTIL